jgi:hypothetical protein
MTIGEEQEGKKRSLRLWIIVCGLSLAFLAYGLVAFLMIGDKGPPGWDFGVVPDTPGKSSFSTAADQSVSPERIEEQHVAGRPSSSETPAREKPR